MSEQRMPKSSAPPCRDSQRCTQGICDSNAKITVESAAFASTTQHNPDMDKLKQIESFVLVAAKGSLTAAAQAA